MTFGRVKSGVPTGTDFTVQGSGSVSIAGVKRRP
jgi:hypothetical protein